MLKDIICENKTVQLAIADAINQPPVNRSYIDIEILSEYKKGFLGFGRILAKVRVLLKEVPVD